MTEGLARTNDGGPEDLAGRLPARRPIYPVLLRLNNIHLSAWQRAALGEGMALVGALLAMADLASAWSIVVLPLAVAVVVKAHDLMAGLLRESTHGRDAQPADPPT